jgi:hypothetical protein
MIHQTSHSRQRYIWVVFVLPVFHLSFLYVTGKDSHTKLYVGFSRLLFYGKKGDRPSRKSPF